LIDFHLLMQWNGSLLLLLFVLGTVNVIALGALLVIYLRKRQRRRSQMIPMQPLGDASHYEIGDDDYDGDGDPEAHRIGIEEEHGDGDVDDASDTNGTNGHAHHHHEEEGDGEGDEGKTGSEKEKEYESSAGLF
jgi:hypothetical protein